MKKQKSTNNTDEEKKRLGEQCVWVEQTKALYNITICAFTPFIYRDIEKKKKKKQVK